MFSRYNRSRSPAWHDPTNRLPDNRNQTYRQQFKADAKDVTRDGSAFRGDKANFRPGEDDINEIRETLKDAYEEYMVENKTVEAIKPKSATFYLSKLIGHLSALQLKDRKRRDKNDKGIAAGEMVIIKERMKNLVDNIPHAVSVEHKPVSAIDMLDIIESTFQNCQTEIERFKQERRCVEREVEKLAEEVSDFTKVREVDTGNVGVEGIQKQIHHIRLQIVCQKREISKRNDDANKASASKTADATDTIKDRIRKLMDNCPEVSLQNKPRSTEDIIYNMELTLQNNQQKINRYEEERRCVEREVEKLAEEVSDKTKVREIGTVDFVEGIQKKIHHIRLQIHRQIREISKRYEEERRCVEREVEKLTEEVLDFSKDREVDTGNVVVEGIQKKIRHIRLQIHRQKREISKRNDDANKASASRTADETETIKNRIRKLMDNFPEASLQNKHRSTEDMLYNIESTLQNNQQKINRYEQERRCVEREFEKLVEDVSDKSKVREVGTDNFVEGIQTQIRHIRLQIDCQKREISKSHKEDKEEQDLILRELQRLGNDIECISTECNLVSNKQTENKVLRTVRDIHQKLVNKKRDEAESKLKLENRCKEQAKTFEELWNVLSEGQTEQDGKQFDRNSVDSKSNWHIIVDHLNRWKADRTQVIRLSGALLKDISTLITSKPFNFTWSERYDTSKLTQGLTPAFQQVVIDINGIKQCLEENCKSFERNFVSVKSVREMSEYQKDLLKEIKELKTEKEELLNRLSKLAGANLTDNNPSIADLSDPNRATKLAEQFSELYDTPWTDAFEVLDIDDEEKCIEYLLNIIAESYKMCEEISVIQQEALITALSCPLEGLTNLDETDKAKQVSDIQLSKIQSHTLSDLRKQTAELSIVDVKKYIAAKNVDWVKKRELKQFTTSCIELCWYMHLQTPPVYIDVTLVPGARFDTDKYKSYTKSGKKVDYLVWPALLLHKNGPLLCKGVAQGK